jgi:eukaryotic-like serine/threonine-protein kinase
MVVLRAVGKYEILSAIGAGSMGTVYRAFDPILQRTVAVKILKRGWTHDISSDEIAARFRTEARAVARLNHPSIVTIFDYDDRDPAGAYIAMEYIEGCALDQYIRQRQAPHLEDVISVVHQMLGGLHYAHQRGVVHRDIKPSNLLLTRDGLIKIMDFGIAKIGSQNLTQSRLMMGTPLYMAPEQYLGGVVDHRCDIYAAGAVLYELLTGSPPFSGTDTEVMYRTCHEKPKPLSTLDLSIAQAFDPIVAKALEKPLENRYTSAADFGEALRSAWQTISPKPLSPKLSDEARAIAVAMSRQPEIDRQSPGSLADTWVRPATVGASRVESRADPVAQPDSTGGGGLAAWSRDQLAEIERQLVPIIGPVAQILVRNAAATTRSRQELYRLLSDHLRTPEERQRFLLAGQTGPSSTVPSNLPNPTVSSNICRRPLTDEVTQRASQLLARYIGPIATVLTRRAAQTAADEAHLYSMLAEKLTDKEERERFLMEAGAHE